MRWRWAVISYRHLSEMWICLLLGACWLILKGWFGTLLLLCIIMTVCRVLYGYICYVRLISAHRKK